MEWIKITKELPPANTLVFVRRFDNKVEKSPIYIGMRRNKPIATNQDASRDCYWNATLLSDITKFPQESSYEFKFSRSFSDVTVDEWSFLTPHSPINKIKN